MCTNIYLKRSSLRVSYSFLSVRCDSNFISFKIQNNYNLNTNSVQVSNPVEHSFTVQNMSVPQGPISAISTFFILINKHYRQSSLTRKDTIFRYNLYFYNINNKQLSILTGKKYLHSIHVLRRHVNIQSSS